MREKNRKKNKVQERKRNLLLEDVHMIMATMPHTQLLNNATKYKHVQNK